MFNLFNISPERSMSEQLTRTAKLLGVVMILCAAGLMLNPGDAFKWGMLLGVVVGVINITLTYIGLSYSLEPQYRSRRGIIYSQITFFVRWVLIIGLIFSSTQVSGLSIYGVAAGLMVAPVISFLDFGIKLLVNYKKAN
ncbi:MAG: ATP synthase subunit I [Desulfotomaculum sp.]|nr:ATP synthase subunit I [Desulfotomaculum sp.]MCL0081515.1 ATP synthase subunit I [Peptococcaceae bacterium]